MKGRKYPKTPHFPFSPGFSVDDVVLTSFDNFINKEIVITEKIDGECTGMTSGHCHARSLDSKDHPSRHWVKQLHAQIKTNIPEGWKFFGENVFAKHSILYENLPTYFFLFAVLNDKDYFISWDETKEWAVLLGMQTVPELWRGIWDLDTIKSVWKGISSFGSTGEGYVVRTIEGFLYNKFAEHTAKFVRKGHVQTDSHWMSQAIVKNVLKDDTQTTSGA